LSGENKGRDIRHVAVAESISKAGTVEKGKNFDRDVLVKVKATPDPANFRLIAFVQESDAGEVVGASLLSPPVKMSLLVNAQVLTVPPPHFFRLRSRLSHWLNNPSVEFRHIWGQVPGANPETMATEEIVDMA
jgi:hypothetical protein